MARASHPIDTLAQVLDPTDTLLAELRLINLVITLRRNQYQLLQLLRDMLGELSQPIEAFVPAIPEKDDDA